MNKQKGITLIEWLVLVIFVVILAFGGWLAWEYVSISQQQLGQSVVPPIFNANANHAPSGQVPQGWSTYQDQKNGFSFSYPASFNTQFASFQQTPSVMVVAVGNASVDAAGCYRDSNADQQTTSAVSIAGKTFCLTQGTGVGAGQLYRSYYYSTARGQFYIVLSYVVHTPNGCGAYQGTPNYQGCQDFMANYTTLVEKPIQNSVATLAFTK